MLQDRTMLFGVAALAAVATAGWVRPPQPAIAAPQGLAIPVNSFTAPAGTMLDPAYASAPSLATPASATAVPVERGVYRTAGTPVAKKYPGTATISQPSAEAADVEHRAPVVKERSKMKSVAIVAGGAATGAAIGGLAGGKKGAAIGALGGGAAGLIYDRMTKNR